MATSPAPDITRSAEVAVGADSANKAIPSDGGPSKIRSDESTALMSNEKLPTSTTEDVDIAIARETSTTTGVDADDVDSTDPLNFGRHRRGNVTRRQMKIDHPRGDKKKLKAFYTKQNELIDQFLGADDEERLAVEEDIRIAPRIKFAVNASFAVNFCLFAIQLYAAVSTGSLSVKCTRLRKFPLFLRVEQRLISSVDSSLRQQQMHLWTSLAARASVYKYPVGRTRIETIGIILFCALMTTVAIQLIVESGRTLGAGESTDSEELHLIPIIFVAVAIFAKGSLMLYCLAYRKYPTVHVFFIDHRNDIVVNIFGLVMSVVGSRFVWYLDPIGAICIGLLILVSWVANAFEQVWLLVGKSAPREFLSKLVYMSMTHDQHIKKVDTCRAYHAGQKYYVEVDVIMDPQLPLKISHDVGQSLQRKLEGLGDVERAFVHVDYEDDHDIHEEHKPLYEKVKPKRTLREILLGAKKTDVATE